MTFTANTTQLTPARIDSWREEIQTFYEQTAAELNQIASVIHAYNTSTTVLSYRDTPARERDRDGVASPNAGTHPTQVTESFYRDIEATSLTGRGNSMTELTRSALPPLDHHPAPVRSTPSRAQVTQPVRPRPVTASGPVNAEPTAAAEATSQDRLALLKQQIAAKLSASPRDEQKTEEPRS